MADVINFPKQKRLRPTEFNEEEAIALSEGAAKELIDLAAKGLGLTDRRLMADLFLEEESQHLAMLIDFIGKPVSLQVESNLSQEQYYIVLM